jgi:hypothetical protein
MIGDLTEKVNLNREGAKDAKIFLGFLIEDC